MIPIAPGSPMGATLVGGGAIFQVWAPTAQAVHIAAAPPGTHGVPNGWNADATNLLALSGGYWSGFIAGVVAGWEYRFWTIGPAGSGFKRDPRAVELEPNSYPDIACIVRGPDAYPWHDAGFQPPSFNDLIIYQLHIGVFYATQDGVDIRKDRVSKFLDAVDRIEYLAALGVNAIEPLPIVEWQGENSRGYNNSDFFSPEMDYALDPADIAPYLDRVNTLLENKGCQPIRAFDVSDQRGQLRALVDLCHVYGMAVIGDVVYNHAGGPLDDQSMRFLSRPFNRQWWDPDDYFIGGPGWAGGVIFDYAVDEVRGFLIDNGRVYFDDFHFDGLRYDEVTVIHFNNGDGLCRDMTATLHYHKPNGIQIAEYWNWDRALPVQPGGLGFDAAWDDRLRVAVRSALSALAVGADAPVDLDPVRDAFRVAPGFPAAWRSVNHLENHDLVDGDKPASDTVPRIAALADQSNHRSWYARSRSRAAMGLLLTAPGIPMLFMGQEFLEDKLWNNNPARDDCFIWWQGLDPSETDGSMRDFQRFTSELCGLRRRHPALRGEGCNPYYVHNGDRVLAVQRWVEGIGRDVLIVASFCETNHWNYALPLPTGGHWIEVFNSDAYDCLPTGGGYNPVAVGNPGGIDGNGPPIAGLPVSANCLLPANSVLVFARDLGD